MITRLIQFSLLIIFILQGCILAPTIDSMRRAGMTASSRRSLLPENIKKFHDALYWGSPSEIMAYVDDDGWPEISKQIEEMQDKERVVESKVKNVEFDSGAFEATVNVTVKAFKIGYYIVTDRHEKQTWTFSMSDGWKILHRELYTANGKGT